MRSETESFYQYSSKNQVIPQQRAWETYRVGVQLFAGKLDKVTENICQDLWIGLADGKHLPSGLFAPIFGVSFQQHWCHLQPFVQQELALFKTRQLHYNERVVVTNVSAVRICQRLEDIITYGRRQNVRYRLDLMQKHNIFFLKKLLTAMASL